MALTETERYLLEGLSRRLDVLKRRTDDALVHSTYVADVHAFMAGNVVRTLILLLGQKFFGDFWHWVDGSLCDDAWLCKLCKSRKEKWEDLMCPACTASMDEDERQADIDEALYEKPPQGGIS